MNLPHSENSPDDVRWIKLRDEVHERNLSRVFLELQDTGFDPTVFKGWAVRRFYDDGHYRTYTDIDLIVPSDQETSFRKLAYSIKKVSIDVHGGLGHLDVTRWNVIFSRTYHAVLGNQKIRVLADEDHLRVICAHWLWDGGVNKEKLYDVYYMVKNRHEDFDWKMCIGEDPNRKTWVLAAIAAARDHLGLDTSKLPPEINEFTLPDWFQMTLAREWKLGPYRRVYSWMAISKPSVFLEQLRRKLPPNPIAATIDVNGKIDSSSRLKYQLQSFAGKLRPALSGLAHRIFSRK